MADIKITTEQIKKVAELAKLDITGEEEKFTKLFIDTLKAVDVLSELDTSKVEETYQVTGLTNIYQKNNELKATLTQEEALSNADDTSKGLIVTKGVFDR